MKTPKVISEFFYGVTQGSGFRQSLPDEKSGELQQMPQSLTQAITSI